MTEVVFEVATINDVIAKAATIAPNKAGNAFDKAAGIMFELTPDDEVKCVVKATNLDVFYLEVVDAHSISGEDARWRLPASVIADVLKNIKPAPGKMITMSHTKGDGRVTIQSGRLKAQIGMIDPDLYPDFEVVEPDKFSPTRGVGSRIEMVSWASAKAGSEPLSGIHFTGEYVVGTDRYRIARVPLAMAALAKPVTVPAGILSTLLKRAGEIEVGCTDHQMIFRPDDYTQITCSVFAMDFPDLSRIYERTYQDSFKVNREEFVGLVNSAGAAATGDRSPILRLILGKGEAAVMLQGNEAMIGNVLELPGQCDHPRISLYFTPSYLTDAVGKAPTDIVTISYHAENESQQALRVDGGQDYQAWIAARRANAPT